MFPLMLLLLPGPCLTSLLEPYNGEEAVERMEPGRETEERMVTAREREERMVQDMESESDMNKTSYNSITVVDQQEQEQVTEPEPYNCWFLWFIL